MIITAEHQVTPYAAPDYNCQPSTGIQSPRFFSIHVLPRHQINFV